MNLVKVAFVAVFGLVIADVALSAGEDWIPYDYTRDIAPGSALDFSQRLDAPAGKYGWLKAVDDHFEFEGLPGIPQRFYGVNLCMGLNIPDSHEDSDRLISRLASIGYNALRIHHHDAYCVDGLPGGELSAEQMDKFDYLYAKAIEKGLYLTTDLYVSRVVTWREIGEDRDGSIEMQTFKALTLFHEGAFECWKKFAANFLLHVNPYTGRRYIDEPAMPLLCTVNEGWMLGGWFNVRERPQVVAAYDQWRAEKLRLYGKDFMAHSCATNVCEANCYGWKNAATALFMAEFQARGHARQVEYLRSLGSRALLTAGNHGPDNAPNGRFRAQLLDYVDTHSYVDHPTHLDSKNRWGLPSWCWNSHPISGSSKGRMDGVSWARVAGKPFTLSEWTFSGPGEYRGICGLYAGTLMSRQDWSGVWRFAYGHGRSCIADVPRDDEVPEYFNVAFDPMIVATERIVANVFLRRDIKPLEKKVNLVIDDRALMPEGGKKGDWETYSLSPVDSDVVWKARCSTSMKEVSNAQNFKLSDWGSKFGARTDGMPLADVTDDVTCLDRSNGVFTVVSDRTCGVFAGKGEHRAGALSCRILEGPATVTVSALDENSIGQACHLLVSHLTDCRGKNACSSRDEKGRYVTESFGAGGVVVRPGLVEVSIKVANSSGWHVYALASTGRRRYELPVRQTDRKISFTVDTRGTDGKGVMEYELVRQ